MSDNSGLYQFKPIGSTSGEVCQQSIAAIAEQGKIVSLIMAQIASTRALLGDSLNVRIHPLSWTDRSLIEQLVDRMLENAQLRSNTLHSQSAVVDQAQGVQLKLDIAQDAASEGN